MWYTNSNLRALGGRCARRGEKRRSFEVRARKLWDIVLVAVFVAAISSLLCYFSFGFTPRESSTSENRKLTTFTAPSWGGVFSGEYQKEFETALSDQAFFREDLLALNSNWNRRMGELAFFLNGRRDGGRIISELQGNIMLFDYKGRRTLLQEPFRYEDEVAERIVSGAKEFEGAVRALPETRFVLCAVEPSFLSAAGPLNSYYPNTVSGRYVDLLLENLPREVEGFAVRSESVDEILDGWYDTDHHFRGPVTAEIYSALYERLSAGRDDFGAQYPLTLWEVPHTEGRGSKARSALYAGIVEPLSELIARPPEYPVTLNGESLPRSHAARVDSGELEKEQAGKNSVDSIYFNYYAEYFGFDYGEIVYDNPDAESDRVLLLVGPSYTQTFEKYLVRGYKRVHVIDPRYYEEYAGEAFSLVDYAKEIEADDVVYCIQPQYLNDDLWRIN